MDTKNNFSDESADDLRIIELLTPKHGRKMPEWPSRPKKRNPLTRISAVAAMMCVCATIALGLMFSVRSNAVPASQIVEQSIAEIAKADSYRINFKYRGCLSDGQLIYEPRPDKELIPGTLYMTASDGIIMARIDWHDNENNSAVWNGDKYFHLKNGKVVKAEPSEKVDDLYRLMSFETFPKEILKKATINENGDIITVTANKNDEIHFSAKFSRKNKKVEKIAVTYTNNGTESEIITADTINYGIPLPLSLFTPGE